MIITEYLSESKETDWRGCLMLELPRCAGEMISAWSRNNIADSDLADEGREDYTHCTVLYGFPQFVTIPMIEKVLPEDQHLAVRLGPIKRFAANEGRPDSDVLVIGVQSLPLTLLNTKLAEKFGVKSPYGAYNPHVTIAYVKPGAKVNLDGNLTFEGYTCVCDKMTYSRGPSENRERTDV